MFNNDFIKHFCLYSVNRPTSVKHGDVQKILVLLVIDPWPFVLNKLQEVNKKSLEANILKNIRHLLAYWLQ